MPIMMIDGTSQIAKKFVGSGTDLAPLFMIMATPVMKMIIVIIKGILRESFILILFSFQSNHCVICIIIIQPPG